MVLELKSGAADENAINQLQQGLRALYESLGPKSLHTRPFAYLAVGQQADTFRFAMRDKLSTLKFGTEQVRLIIIECGTTISL